MFCGLTGKEEALNWNSEGLNVENLDGVGELS